MFLEWVSWVIDADWNSEGEHSPRALCSGWRMGWCSCWCCVCMCVCVCTWGGLPVLPSSCEGAIPALPGAPHLSSSINPCLPRVSGPKTTPHWSDGADKYRPPVPAPGPPPHHSAAPSRWPHSPQAPWGCRFTPKKPPAAEPPALVASSRRPAAMGALAKRLLPNIGKQKTKGGPPPAGHLRSPWPLSPPTPVFLLFSSFRPLFHVTNRKLVSSLSGGWRRPARRARSARTGWGRPPGVPRAPRPSQGGACPRRRPGRGFA